MKRRAGRRGFTLIELIMVIIILGVLSAVAIPKYIDMQAEAKEAAANGVLGAAASACAINYAARQTKTPPPAAITTCALLTAAMDVSGVTVGDGGGSDCAITVQNDSYHFTLSPETDATPCMVEKVSGQWPSP